MSPPRIAELSERLIIEAEVRTPDGGGGATVAWEEVAEVWAAVRAVVGHEASEADAASGRVSHEIWLRHRDDVAPRHRFRLGARLFDIRAVLPAPRRRTLLRCLCEERVP